MASALLCNSCDLQSRRLASITQDLRAEISLFPERRAKAIQSPTGPNQIPPAPPWLAKKYTLPSSKHRRPDCPLCNLFSSAFPNEATHELLNLFTFTSYFGSKSEPQDCEDMCVGVHRGLGTDPLGPSPLVIMSDTRAEARFGRPRRIKTFADWATLTSWIDLCRRHHGGECKEEGGGGGAPEIQGLKLIDCQSWSVVRAMAGTKWVALSYVWSLASPRAVSSDGRILPSQSGSGRAEMALPNVLPGIILDAMEATLALGYRYLWTDQFCIDQSNKVEVADQVGKMDRIYRGAELTIVAASARNGLPGARALPRAEPESVVVDHVNFFVAPMEPVQGLASSVWSTRGWCYQEEMLSRRLLYFTEAGALFRCSTATFYEVIGGPGLVADPQEMETKSREHQIPNETGVPGRRINYKSVLDRCLSGKGSTARSVSTARFHIMAAHQVIAEFTKKRLSFDSDSLNAVSGVLNVFGDMDPPVRFCQGLPVSQDVSAHFTDSLLLESLCWYHQDPASVQRRDHLPSWSWAGWSGTISWPRLSVPGYFSNGKLQSHLPDWNGFDAKHDARVLAIAGGCAYSPSCNSTDAGKTTHDCRSGAGCSPFASKFIFLEARAVPASFFAFRPSKSKTQERTWNDLVLRVDNGHPIQYDHYSYHARDFAQTQEEVVTSRAIRVLSCQEFVDRVRKGELECILLGEQLESRIHVSIHLLVVEWVSTGLAQRVDCVRFVLEWDPDEPVTRPFVDDLFSRLTILPKKQLWLS